MNEIVTTLLAILQTAFGDDFNLYWNGKIDQNIIRNNMPMIAVTGIKTNNDRSGTLRDNTWFRMSIDVFLDVAQYLNTNSENDTTMAQQALENIVEARDSNGQLLTNTLMYVLNQNLPIGSTVIYTDKYEITYDDYYPRSAFPVPHVRFLFTAFARPNR